MSPCDYSKYPADWKQIREKILERAKSCCEFCAVPNYSEHPETGSKVVLTIAHLDHDVTNNADSNLRALCQKCHNGHDVKFRRGNRLRKERETRIKEGQTEL